MPSRPSLTRGLFSKIGIMLNSHIQAVYTCYIKLQNLCRCYIPNIAYYVQKWLCKIDDGFVALHV